MTNPSDPKDSTVVPTHRDILQELRDAQGDAEKVSLAQARLQGQMDQAMKDLVIKDARVGAFARIVDEIRTDVDDIANEADLIPEPYRTIVKQVRHWIDVADDALKASE